MILYFYNNNDFQHVVQYSEIGIAHYAQIGDLFNEAGCTMTLANAYQRFGQLDKALECYNRCSDLMDEIGGEMAAVNKRYVMNNIAEIHLSKATFQMGRTDEGLALMEQALGIAEENGDVFMEAVSHVQRGQFERRLHHNAEAEMDFQKAIAIAEENHFAEVLQEALESIVPVVRPRNPE